MFWSACRSVQDGPIVWFEQIQSQRHAAQAVVESPLICPQLCYRTLRCRVLAGQIGFVPAATTQRDTRTEPQHEILSLPSEPCELWVSNLVQTARGVGAALRIADRSHAQYDAP